MSNQPGETIISEIIKWSSATDLITRSSGCGASEIKAESGS